MKHILYTIIVLSIFSCSSKHNIYINKDNSANINFEVENKKSLIENLKEWGAVQSSTDGSVIDVTEVKKGFTNDSNFSDVNITGDSNSNFKGSLFVKDINMLFSNSENKIPEELKIFSLKEADGIKTLSIMLSLENYKYLQQNLPVLQNESVDMLGPVANQELSKEEYLDMISFTLQEEGPKELLASNIELKITVDGSITNVNGGELIDSSSCLINIPLIDVILLKKKLLYSVTYK